MEEFLHLRRGLGRLVAVSGRSGGFSKSLYIFIPHSTTLPLNTFSFFKISKELKILPLLPPNPKKRLTYAVSLGGSSQNYFHRLPLSSTKSPRVMCMVSLLSLLGLPFNTKIFTMSSFQRNIKDCLDLLFHMAYPKSRSRSDCPPGRRYNRCAVPKAR